jgi:hypothetical protein
MSFNGSVILNKNDLEERLKNISKIKIKLGAFTTTNLDKKTIETLPARPKEAAIPSACTKSDL